MARDVKPEQAALIYVARGWHVLPLHTIHNGRCTCGRSSCHSPGKHPATERGLKDATTNSALITAWWSTGDWNVGIRTGEVSGLIVVDVDPRNGGMDSMQAIEAIYGPMPTTRIVLTGSGGLHYYLDYEPVSTRKLARGVDLKSDGGYVVAPPSLHASGQRYRWRNQI